MVTRFFTLGLSVVVFLSGCATAEKSTWLGAGVGAGLGAGLGILATSSEDPRQRTQGAMIGAAALGILGAVIGNQAYKDNAKKEQARQADLNSARLEMFGGVGKEQGKPALRPAQVRVRYVEDQIKDGTFIPAHFEYEISEPARWER